MPTQTCEGWTIGKAATAGAIMGLLIAVVLITALAPTIITQAENARAEVAANTSVNQGGASIFAMYPLFWAIVGLAIIAGAVIAQTKGI